jgi:hypothetical protein
MRLNGSPLSPPCLGGPPTLKNPLRLLPTFQTVTSPPSSETVIKRRPSGEKLTEETGAWCGSSTYKREAVLRSYLVVSQAVVTATHMMTAPSCVPTASRCVPLWKSMVEKLCISQTSQRGRLKR